MCSNYPGIKLEPALQRYEDIIEHLSSCAHIVHTNALTDRFTWWKELERLPKMHVQSVQKYCFSLSNMQICHVLVAVVVVVALTPS